MKRKATSIWNGSLKEGNGTLDTQSGVLEKQPYTFNARFVDESGKSATNPEELIAAAHAGCFNMAFSNMLTQEGHTPGKLTTTATVSLEKKDGGFAVTRSALKVEAEVEGIAQEKFQEIAGKAKEGCPISKALSIEITLDATLT